MIITIRNEMIREMGKPKFKKSILTKFSREEVSEYFSWHYDMTIDLNKLSDKDMNKIIKVCQKYPNVRGTKTIIRDIKAWQDLKQHNLRTVKRVKDFDSVLIQYLKDIDGHRIYGHDSFDPDAVLSYRVTNVEYKPKQVHNYDTTPEHVVMTIVYKRFGLEQDTTVTFWRKDIITYTPDKALIEKGFRSETPDLRKQYLNDIKKYTKIHKQVGKQFMANGGGRDDTLDGSEDDYRRYRRSGKGEPFVLANQKIIVDVFMENEGKYEELLSHGHVEDGAWWWSHIDGKIGNVNDDEDEGDEYENPDAEVDVEIPIHPHVVIFDLTRHIRMTTHINFLKEYVYDESLADKLVLDDEVKQLIETLVSGKSEFNDIIKGKSGGTVILLGGSAGVGKTLTAEVFAEYQHKPLYNVQASQLGLNPVELESELKRVLRRSARWDSILLIDEADVYVHARGNDINQNAIVGVFLRVLEYHNATIFLTTNIPEVVDDAIISRCIAKIQYKYPTKEQQIKIWKIISKTSKIKIDDKVILEFVEKYNEYTGRDIKNILKLSSLKAKADGKPISMKMLKFIIRFNPSIKKKEND